MCCPEEWNCLCRWSSTIESVIEGVTTGAGSESCRFSISTHCFCLIEFLEGIVVDAVSYPSACQFLPIQLRFITESTKVLLDVVLVEWRNQNVQKQWWPICIVQNEIDRTDCIAIAYRLVVYLQRVVVGCDAEHGATQDGDDDPADWRYDASSIETDAVQLEIVSSTGVEGTTVGILFRIEILTVFLMWLLRTGFELEGQSPVILRHREML